MNPCSGSDIVFDVMLESSAVENKHIFGNRIPWK